MNADIHDEWYTIHDEYLHYLSVKGFKQWRLLTQWRLKNKYIVLIVLFYLFDLNAQKLYNLLFDPFDPTCSLFTYVLADNFR